MEVIVPAAGLSTRFPNTKPKYLLYGYDGIMMLKRALQPYLNNPDINITIGILKEHDEKFYASDFIRNELGDKINIIVLPEVTRGPADTVMQIMNYAAIDYNRPLLVKDCDSFFDHEIFMPGNYICTSQILKHTRSTNIANKSFIVQNTGNIVQQIIEKHIVSDTICVGGYKFHAAHVFRDAFYNVESVINGEIYVSHVIQFCIENLGHVFLTNNVTDYTDVGTLEEWIKYNYKPTIFCDIDGTIIVAQGRWGSNNYLTPPVPLEQNITLLKSYQKNGSQLIFTTSRPETAKETTVRMLESLGFKNFQLIIGLNNSPRILINDYNVSNPYPTACAINIKRDSDTLSDFLDKI